MSDLTSPAQSDFIVECRRLHQLHLDALASKDAETIQAAADELALFLRYNQMGRLPEYFRSRQTRTDTL